MKRRDVSSSGQLMTVWDTHNSLGVKCPFFFHSDTNFPPCICWRQIEQQDTLGTTELFTEAPDSAFNSFWWCKWKTFSQNHWQVRYSVSPPTPYTLPSKLTSQAPFLFTYLWREVKCPLCVCSLFLIYTDPYRREPLRPFSHNSIKVPFCI